MSDPRTRKLALWSLLAVLASSAPWIGPGSAGAESALFRAKRTWYFGPSAVPWTTLTPPTGKGSYRPPAIAGVGSTPSHPRFTVPKSTFKNTTNSWSCGPPPYPRYCFPSYRIMRTHYSCWNAKGSFRASHPNAPTATTTIRFATTMSDPAKAPTAMYEPVTPTTTWDGRYDQSRGGSIMIWPGPRRFGGTLRFFEGPNSLWYLFGTYGPNSSRYLHTFPPRPLSQQLGTGVEIAIGEVEEVYIGLRYRLTRWLQQKVVIGTTPLGGPEYDMDTAHYLFTRAPYTTGMAQAWEPNGNTNTIQTETGYDNRTPAGLSGTISLVHPRLVHVYTVFPESSGKPIAMTWSSARLRKIDFRFLPEPAGLALLISGIAVLAGLRRARSR